MTTPRPPGCTCDAAPEYAPCPTCWAAVTAVEAAAWAEYDKAASAEYARLADEEAKRQAAEQAGMAEMYAAFEAMVKPDAWEEIDSGDEDAPAHACTFPPHRFDIDRGYVDAVRECSVCGKVEQQNLFSEPDYPGY